MAIPNILDEDHTDAAAQLLRTYYRRTAAGLPARLREVRRVSGIADRQAPPPANGSNRGLRQRAGSPGHGCISLTLGPP
ncbi:hypothetical protein [Pseudarthrobacter sp. BIM B-2242]|uniref:hypothetical protein n=1 Tax=Pseudarthrobacter sp. BIM B-2242 TaxID=2772401 RepID=UPI00168B3C38|nr:hypothetical protein [Pseudarthrobacter sp. BIM B-2242]QOD04300.1 hypothetical protein IDT60_04360 [Pseudarthrobacter sp. BIM B-2242]